MIKPQDISSDDERLLVVKTVADALSAADDLDDAAVSVLQRVCVPLEWQRGELWVVDRPAGRIRLRYAWHDPAAGAAGDRFDAASRGLAFGLGVGLPGQVWRTGAPLSVADACRDPAFQRRPGVEAAGLRGAVAVPVRAAGAVVGALLFFSGRAREPAPLTLTLLAAVAGQVGLLLRCQPPGHGVDGTGDAADVALAQERAARAEAERVGRLKDEFLAVVSHELRTPLNAVLGWAQVLRGARDPAEVAEAVAVIERNARVQARLIDDLLDLSRIIGGQVRLDSRRVELDQVVEAAIDAVLPAAAARRVRIDARVEPFAAPVMGDPARLQQVVWNLLTNAVKHAPEGGWVRVGLDADDDPAAVADATITVSDNGSGIAPEALPHIFERFRQGAASAGGKRKGLGLGLAIVRHLVEMHGGTVRADSPGVGRGATFTVTLPLAVLFEGPGGRSAPAAAGAGAAPAPRLDAAHVLVVDDEPDARRFLERILRDAGATVTMADSMPAALAALDAGAYDLLVSDIAMPDHDGYELIHRVRQRPADKGGLIRAMALTAFAAEADLRRSLGAGFNMHLNKPVEAADLLSAAARLLGSRLQA